MITVFYKQEPTVDTPYRQLVLKYSKGWQVCVLAGTKWGREHAEKIRVIPAKTFEDAKQCFDNVFAELQADGWRAYRPYEPW